MWLYHFCPPPSRSEIGGLLNSPSSFRPSVHLESEKAPFVSKPPRENHHYIIKAGDTRATRTLVGGPFAHYSLTHETLTKIILILTL